MIYFPYPLDSTLSIVSQFVSNNQGWGARNRKGYVGHGTNFSAIFTEANKAYDRILIFSDMQGWIGYNTPMAAFNSYKKEHNASPKVYSIDMAGYGTIQFPEPNVFCLTGFSEKIFDLMKYLETDKKALINTVNAIDL